MPLIDHFHAPVYPLHSWESFHSWWAVNLAESLIALLPVERFLVEVQVTLGTRVEADVAEFESPEGVAVNGAGGVAVQTWAPPAAVETVSMVFPDDIEVQVFDLLYGKRLAGVIELVSPSNKDRPDSRRAFAAKCVAYLQRGVGLVVVDIVTARRFNLHHETLRLLGQDPERSPQLGDLYAVAYRPVRRDEQNLLDLWPHALAVGQPLPCLPLGLRGTIFVPVDLEATYSDTRRRCRL
jgi:hypothetical protein